MFKDLEGCKNDLLKKTVSNVKEGGGAVEA